MIDNTTKITITCMLLTLTIGLAVQTGPFYPVTGDSMEPTFHNPGIAHCEPVDNPADLEPGDIIAYEYMDNTYSHRVGENPSPASLHNTTLTTTRDNPAYDNGNIVQYSNVKCEITGHITLDPRHWT